MPEMLGTFENNLVLHDEVCLDCNNSFSSRELAFGRDTGEGVLRLQFGLKKADEANEVGRRRATPRLQDKGPWRGARMLYRGGDEGRMSYPAPQVGFAPKDGTDDPEITWLDEADLSEDAVAPYRVGFRISILGDTDEVLQRLMLRLAELRIEMNDSHPMPRPGTRVEGSADDDDQTFRVDVESSYEIGEDIARTIAKIAFNYVAYFAGDCVRQRDFDEIRAFIRYGTPLPWLPIIADNRPILVHETISNSHLVAVEWLTRRDGAALVARVSPFNAVKYHVMLCRRFAGIWFPFRQGHAFDFEQRKVLPLVSTRLAP